ncbi:MAG: ABC transporter ATP-binding protein, partial [Candidatus Thorarchaeota archaeon]
QLIIFELYLNRLFGIMLFEQDIRILFGVVSAIYASIFYISLKKFFLPKAEEKSQLKIQKAFEIVQERDEQEIISGGNHAILDVEDLTTYFHTEEGTVRAVEGVSFKVYEGEVLGLVGETGCGKSVTALSLLRVIRPPGKIEKGSVVFRGEDLLKKPELEMLKYRGKDITMIFQDPLNSLNPVFKIGKQISEVFLLHMENELLIEASKYPNKTTYGIARQWSIDLLRELNIPFPDVIIDRYPHELSGGMRQRVQIAMGLACRPKLLIADEPTTALDVTIQNQILKLMKDLRKRFNTTILFITHDLGIISKMCNRVAVMYCGSIVESGNIKTIFTTPYHPYTRGLIASVPVMRKRQQELEVIPGMVPNLIYPPSGCRFHPRCRYSFEPCDSKIPIQNEIGPDYFVACHLYDPEYKSLAEISIKKVESISEKLEVIDYD